MPAITPRESRPPKTWTPEVQGLSTPTNSSIWFRSGEPNAKAFADQLLAEPLCAEKGH